MSIPEKTPPLRLAPAGNAGGTGPRFERETRPVLLQRETQLENSLAPFKVGSVPYLNAAPLTRGLEEQIIFAPPSELAGPAAAGRIGRRAGQRHGSLAARPLRYS